MLVDELILPENASLFLEQAVEDFSVFVGYHAFLGGLLDCRILVVNQVDELEAPLVADELVDTSRLSSLWSTA